MDDKQYAEAKAELNALQQQAVKYIMNGGMIPTDLRLLLSAARERVLAMKIDQRKVEAQK